MMAPIRPQPPAKRKAKILMLHGNCQSGDFFQIKTRAIRERFHEVLCSSLSKGQNPSFPGGVEFVYPDAPFTIPDNRPVDDLVENKYSINSLIRGSYNDRNQIDSRIWGYGDIHEDNFIGPECSIPYLRDIIRNDGPFIGIMGFSSGACLALILTTLLERERNGIQEGKPKFHHPPFWFTVCFSGFRLSHPKYHSYYTHPIQTPILHIAGNYDSMIPPTETEGLLELCPNGKLVCFDGTHYVPHEEEVTNKVVQFMSESIGWKNGPSLFDDWEDM